jgi:hypothetical protein
MVYRALKATGEESSAAPLFMGSNFETLVVTELGEERKEELSECGLGSYMWRRLSKRRFSDEVYEKMFRT